MKDPWFKRFGWVYCPVSLPGAALVLLGVAFSLQVFRAIDRHSHSASDTLFGFFPYAACVFLLLNWVAQNSSRPH